jgi:hypothetical protein
MNREMKWGSQIKLLTYWGGIQEQREKNKVKNMKYLNEVRSFLIRSTPNILLHDTPFLIPSIFLYSVIFFQQYFMLHFSLRHSITAIFLYKSIFYALCSIEELYD